MLIKEIYEKYKIPLNLQKHMLRVAAVGKIVSENLAGIEIDVDLVVKTLLLHDMGNILKFNLSKTDMLEEEDRNRVDELVKIQQEFRDKYGSDTDEATISIIREISSDKRIVELCANSHGEHAHLFMDGDDWEKKIAYYADMRIGPNGVLLAADRFDDLIRRNIDRKEELERYKAECFEIEKQLQKYSRINLDEIDNSQLMQYFEKFLEIEIS